MKTRLLTFLLAPAFTTAAPLPFAVGTNTGGGGKSEGIYLSTFDTETGTISGAKLGAKYGSPGFLVLHPEKPLLYSIGRSEAHPQGSLAVFKLGDTLEFLDETSSRGRGPCHLAMDPGGKVIAVANYGDGSTATVRLDGRGLFAGGGFTHIVAGKGPRTDRQDGPHAHGVYFRGDRLLVPDLGIDKVLVYRVDPSTAMKADGEPGFWSSAPGAGPRHMDFPPDGRHAYVVNELDNTVAACRFGEGLPETIHTVPTLPEDWSGANTTAEIAVHPNGRFVYASNRGHDSIAVFRRDSADGTLERIQIAPCGGKVPRHFTIAPGGKWLLCAHQESNTIRALPLDPVTGLLGEPGEAAEFPNPICILFLPVRE